MTKRNVKGKSDRWKLLACAVLCLLTTGMFGAAATAKDKPKTFITLTASSAEMVQDGEMPALTAKASVQGEKDLVLDEKSGYTVKDLVKSFNKGEQYQLVCKADGKLDGEFSIDVVLSDEIEEALVKDWLGKVKIALKSGTFVVKNKYGEWEDRKFKKTDGSFAASEFISYRGDTYYFNKDGEMLTGKHRLGIRECEFSEDGKLLSEVSRIDPEKPMLALTFDDGPGPGTDRILETLEQYGARATFFMLGQKADRYPQTVQKMQEIGCELGNHTTSHKDLKKLAPEEIKREISTTYESVAKATGGHGTTVVRPPYGSVNDKVKQNAGQPLIMWSIDTLDWKTRNTQSTIDSVLNDAKDGDIVLMHDIHSPTVEAAVQLIPLPG